MPDSSQADSLEFELGGLAPTPKRFNPTIVEIIGDYRYKIDLEHKIVQRVPLLASDQLGTAFFELKVLGDRSEVQAEALEVPEIPELVSIPEPKHKVRRTRLKPLTSNLKLSRRAYHLTAIVCTIVFVAGGILVAFLLV